MYLKMRFFLLFCLSVFLFSCSHDSQQNSLKSLAKMVEPNFTGKQEATDQINQLTTDYLATFNSDSTSFEDRYKLFSNRYLSKYQGLINHALVTKKSTLETLTLGDQIQVFSLRNTFSADTLVGLSVKEVLAKINEGLMYLGMSEARLENLMFYSGQEAVGGIKSTFSIAPVAFLKEDGIWKIDPMGDPLHQKMKEEKLASLQQKTYAEYKTFMHEALQLTDESWVPLKDR
ncbi:MAG: hypothetical protein KDC85_13150 [Saprospiraceae bacterium]|nr:hypothetical protein [Saprospiraceae bacterium]MCB9325506.1 hypothetical protein [Lewinellaceae bacterium]